MGIKLNLEDNRMPINGILFICQIHIKMLLTLILEPLRNNARNSQKRVAPVQTNGKSLSVIVLRYT